MALNEPALQAAWQRVDKHYFSLAGDLIERVLTAGSTDGHYGMDPAGFAALYVPDMNTLFELRDQSNTDFLTGLPNRRALYAACEQGLAQARRHVFGLVMILLDVDHFKQFNDRLGHATGDRALIEVAQAVQRVLRRGDLAARHGGEEFVVLLSHCDLAQGLAFAERLREAIASAPVPCPSGEVAHVTASLGVADTGRHGLDADRLLAQADAAMYRDKQAGRNRVVVADAAS